MSNDIRTAGSANVCAGEYNNISTAGSCHITGDIICANLKTAGSCHADGAIKCSGNIETAGSCHLEGAVECAGKISTAGSFHIEGTVSAGSVKTAGSGHFDSDVRAKTFETSGSCEIGGSLRADSIGCAGSVEIGGDCEGENIRLYSPQISGLLNGGTVEIKLGDKNAEIGSVGCEKLAVVYDKEKAVTRFLGFNRPFGGCELKTGTIEADEVALVGTKADKISCVNAVIGENCEIGLLEYSGSVEISPSAAVKEQRKI